MTIGRRVNPNPFELGARVAFSREFLKSAGMYTGWAPFARGTVDRIDGLLCIIKWDDAPPSGVTCSNLVLVDKLHLEKS